MASSTTSEAERRPLHLVLASGSPRRRQLLAGLGIEAEVRPADVDETPLAGEAAEPYVLRLAASKARARGKGDELVLAADTVVVLDGDLLGKPRDPDDARHMLRRLSGRDHEVLTGVAVFHPARDRSWSEVARTRVEMARLSAQEIDWYVASGEPMDKAGAYAIQGLGALFVERLEGNYSNVVGLPIPLTYRLLEGAGFEVISRRT